MLKTTSNNTLGALEFPYRGSLNLSRRGLREFPGGLVGKESAANVGDVGFISGSGRFPGVGNGNLFQYSCLKNPMVRGAWQATVHEVTESHTTGHTRTTTAREFTLELHLHSKETVFA